MDQDRLRWITSPPSLDCVEIGLRFASTPAGFLMMYTVIGHSDRKRGALWTMSDTALCGGDTYDLADRLHQLGVMLPSALPTTKGAVERALSGHYWEQGEFPF